MDDEKEAKVNEWLRFADGDLVDAEIILANCPPGSPEGVCYHAQQAAEKAIKAVIAAKKGVAAIPPPTNDLCSLLKEIEGCVNAAQKGACDPRGAATLSRYADEEAFPVDDLSLTERDAREAVEMAKGLVAWCKGVIREKTDCALDAEVLDEQCGKVGEPQGKDGGAAEKPTGRQDEGKRPEGRDNDRGR